MDEEGNPAVVRGIPKVISVRQNSVMQLKKLCRKGFQLYVAHIEEEIENETPRLEDYPVLQDFKDVFPDEVLGLPQIGTYISQLKSCQDQHQCQENPTEKVHHKC